MAEDTAPVAKKSGRKKLWFIIGAVVLIVAAAGAGVALHWWQTRDNGDGASTPTPTLTGPAGDLQNLRSEGSEEEFNEKVADILADPNLDNETRYQVLLQQGHNFADRQEMQGAIEAYLEAEKLQETHEVAELLANTYARAGDTAKAIEYFEKASDLVPDDNPRRVAIQELYADYIRQLENGEQLEEVEE